MAGDKTEDTEETPAYPSKALTPESDPAVDPWVELTDAGTDDDDEPEVIDALGWVEQDFPPDGPVAAPIDALAPTGDLEPPPIRATPPPKPRGPSMRSRFVDEMEPTQYRQEVRALLNQPVVVPRKTPARKTSGVARREVTPPPRARSKAPAGKPASPRRYPKMMSLLKDAESVPYGSAPKSEPPPPPVPGTFFPAPRAPLYERPAPADLDELLATMAEGLLIGESPDGGTEVRVTLRDEFFAGTELRIRINNGEISAELRPPDRDIYWQLNGNIDELKERLSARGLTVRELVLLEP
jgi:hypothetical protein